MKQDLELEQDIWRGRTYKEDMQRERSEAIAKEKAKGVEERANAMVDGAGLWVECQLNIARSFCVTS